MDRYFVPDRSNRKPEHPEDPEVHELDYGAEIVGELADGRPYIREISAVEGYTLVDYYFDPAGLEQASIEELAALLKSSGIEWEPDPGSDTEFHLSARLVDDARGRRVWEFQVTYEPDL